MIKIIIAGGRCFKDYNLLKLSCNELIPDGINVEIVSGTANGADRLGERYAASREFSIKRFPAEWNEYGKAAGPIRNKEMAKYADGLIVFWDGYSKGTKSMIDLAREHNLHIEIIKYK